MDKPLVSVVVATYNAADYVVDAVASILCQTWTNLEVIIVDDGSTDGTQQVLEQVLDDSRVRYIKTENKGQPQAKNRGIHESKGDFVAFCDADDAWRFDKLELQVPEFTDPDVGVVYSDVSYLDKDSVILVKEQPSKRYSGWVTEQLVVRNFIPFGTAVIRRSCIEMSGVFDETLPMGIDWDLWLRYSVRWKFIHVAQKTYFYRIWSGQMSTDFRGRYDNAFRILQKFIHENPSVLSRSLVNRAWSDMYSNRAIHVARGENIIVQPLVDVFKGISKDPFYWPAWKTLIKILVRHL